MNNGNLFTADPILKVAMDKNPGPGEVLIWKTVLTLLSLLISYISILFPLPHFLSLIAFPFLFVYDEASFKTATLNMLEGRATQWINLDWAIGLGGSFDLFPVHP